MIQPNNPILCRMLDRLFAAMLNGPSMNCRPHASRQRLDLLQIARLNDVLPGEVLRAMIGKKGSIRLAARVPLPSRKAILDGDAGSGQAAAQEAAQEAWSQQQAVRSKLRVIAEDARTYEQDTGVRALQIGFPLLSLPPGMFGGQTGNAPSRRVLAPIAFIPLSMAVKTAGQHAVDLARREDEEAVVPNLALLAWLERESGRPLSELLNSAASAAVNDQLGADTWTDITALVRAVADVVEVAIPGMFAVDEMPQAIELAPTPKADDEACAAILPSAVLGLFPAANQGLLRDTHEMIECGVADGPIASFVRLGTSLDNRPAPDPAGVSAKVAGPLTDRAANARRDFARERLVTDADPCQARAVRMARDLQGLVIHGPPGTGKSQTITNIISDHLGRGQRVLFVCDKRTALDVVADRLQSLGLGELCAIVHDPQRDQRDLYRAVREQLDGLVDVQPRARAEAELAKVDADLQVLHADLSAYHAMLLKSGGEAGADGAAGGQAGSFHHLVGLWLAETGCPEAKLDDELLAQTPVAELRLHGARLKELLERAQACAYRSNPWRVAAGIELADFLAMPMEKLRALMNSIMQQAEVVDTARDPLAPAYAAGISLAQQAEARVKLAEQLNATLQRTAAADRARWAGRALNLVIAARRRITDAAEWIELLKTGRDDVSIKPATDATADDLAADRATLGKYLKRFEAHVTELARIKRDAGPDADEAMILRWLAAGGGAVSNALSRLRSAQALASRVAQSTIDLSCALKLEKLEIDDAKTAQWNAILDAYLEIADRPLRSLYFARKREAAGVLRQFGKGLGAASAREVRDLLDGLQARRDLKAVIEEVSGAPLAGRIDDDGLLAQFFAFDTVLSAIAAGPSATRGPADNPPAPAEQLIPALNALAGPAAAGAAKVLESYQLELSPMSAARAESALKRIEARMRVADLYQRVLAAPGAATPADDDELISATESQAAMLDLLVRSRDVAQTRPEVTQSILRAMREPNHADAIVKALQESPRRAGAMAKLEEMMRRAALFDTRWLGKCFAGMRGSAAVLPAARSLAGSIESMEGVLRIREGLRQLPQPLAAAATRLISAAAEPNAGYSAVRRAVLAGEITRRLRQEPNLQTIDGHRLKNTFDRYLELTARKSHLVREVIAGHWAQRQKGRLLNEDQSRLNALGADLRRRLSGRGDKAMRLRQVIRHGADVEGGDPLFDLRPVWMASPETVAQLFPRLPIFDLVVFDEASQCRLEEALPVLTRAQRVVIAGDPKQLPPTRFFESSLASSDEDDADGEQELFEQHQGEIEDVLSAALGLDIHQCYLDVHYRSRHADLIGFSNEQFYGSRLQAIPEHPQRRVRQAPLSLVHTRGTYEKRRNEAEADAVVKLVRELLSQPQPPSIGIASFNLPQRDLIVEKLDEAAEEDADFAARLAEARGRRGENSFEGLFIKNLENVQGDERDHLIISTTYGPDRNGKFRRNFGPVGKPGGGRRLNVLVTRAREQIHIVTSIPRGEYATLPAIPQGESPSGTWLLFAYLNHCERLADDYATARRILDNTPVDANAQVNLLSSLSPSPFARALAGKLVTLHNVGSDVHWGNEGFCVDLALHHPHRAEDVSIGVLCDTTRFGTDDPVEWEVFRTQILREQGWRIHRVWTPHFFRDPAACMESILREVEQAVGTERSAKSPAHLVTPEAAATSGMTQSSTPAAPSRRRAGKKGAGKNAA